MLADLAVSYPCVQATGTIRQIQSVFHPSIRHSNPVLFIYFLFLIYFNCFVLQLFLFIIHSNILFSCHGKMAPVCIGPAVCLDLCLPLYCFVSALVVYDCQTLLDSTASQETLFGWQKPRTSLNSFLPYQPTCGAHLLSLYRGSIPNGRRSLKPFW